MAKKLKTKLVFEFDAQELEKQVPEFNFEVDMKTNSTNQSINIIEVKKKKKKVLDASTKLF
jgi:hypothetical protein